MIKKRKRWRLRLNALLDGISGVACYPTLRVDKYSNLSKYRRGQSDVERSWLAVGQYLKSAMSEYQSNGRGNT